MTPVVDEAALAEVFRADDWDHFDCGACYRGEHDLAEIHARALLASPALADLLRAERARALREAADAIQALHPGEVKNSVTFLRDRAERELAATDE